MSPFLPLIGGGKTKFQPILVTDLVNIIIKCIYKRFDQGQIIELGGPDILSFVDILKFLLKELKIKRLLLNLPFPLARKVGYVFEHLPGSLLTRDQVEMLKTDNVVDKKYSHTKFFNIELTSFFVFAKKQIKLFQKNGGH